MDKIRVLIADDTIVYRKILSEAVENTGVAVVSHTASNGLIAIDWMKQKDIDVVLMDVFMPEMDGIEALKVIKRDYPGIDVIMISGGSKHSAEMTVEALNLGAVDFILKPSESTPVKNIEKIRTQLQILFTQIKLRKYRYAETKGVQKSGFQNIPKSEAKKDIGYKSGIFNSNKLSKVDLVLVASSTGGPAALEKICTGFDADFNKPILVVQHMPAQFTGLLAESLNKKCKLNVKEAKDNDPVQNGQILIAPGGFHMQVEKNGSPGVFIRTESTQYVNGVRPSADVLFTSAARVYENKSILAVVLTGMGSDGKQGILELKQKCSCYCITQSEKSCVVYGMPRSVYEAGVSDEVVDLDSISKRIQQIASGRS